MLIAGATLLSICGSQAVADTGTAQVADGAPAPAASQAVARPDLAACPTREPVDPELRPRTEAIPIPATLRETMRSDIDNFAFSTLGGATLCVDASWMDAIDNPALSADRRFASFDWEAYEAFGHVIVDRSGKGSVLDTGVQPVTSPSGELMAAADLSESGYGALNAFAVWQVEPTGLRQLARREETPPATDWKIEGWAGEDCIDLSAVLWDNLTDPDRSGDPPRDRYRSRRSNDWHLESGRCPIA